MNKLTNALLLVLIAITLSFCILLPSLSADLAERQTSETIFQQSVRIVTLESRLTKAMETAQETVYAMERRETLLEETAMKLQTAMTDLSELESNLDKKTYQLKIVKNNLLKTESELERTILSRTLLRTKVKDLAKEVIKLKKKLNLKVSEPDPDATASMTY